MYELFVGLSAVMAVPLVSALAPIETFYPPMLNDISYISDTSLGTYGGTYISPTTAPNTSLPYGTYDYCQMPHPRVQEYALPAAIADGSVTGKIVFLEYLQRHQRRTPYNIFPDGESAPFECDNIQPFLYNAASQGDMPPVPVYAQTYTSPTNPFVSHYIPGSCQYPQLTIGGLLDGFTHGEDLRAVYGDKLGLFPSNPDSSTWFRSSTSALTQGSAGGVLRGVFPTYGGSIPLHQQSASLDTVDEGYEGFCDAISTVLSDIESTAEWDAHLNVTASLRSTLGSLLGATTSAWQDTFDHFSDNFQGRLCNGYALPCNVTNPSACVTMDQANEVFRAGDWEWNYYWRTNPNVTLYIQLVEGLFIGEIVGHLQAVVDGNSSLKYSHVFIHDGDIGPVLGALGIEQLRWPAMGSNIAFEVWETNKGLYSRVLYSGQPLRTIHGVLDWLPLTSLIAILQPFVPSDIVALCNA